MTSYHACFICKISLHITLFTKDGCSCTSKIKKIWFFTAFRDTGIPHFINFCYSSQLMFIRSFFLQRQRITNTIRWEVARSRTHVLHPPIQSVCTPCCECTESSVFLMVTVYPQIFVISPHQATKHLKVVVRGVDYPKKLMNNNDAASCIGSAMRK